jgi:hypothetical protein
VRAPSGGSATITATSAPNCHTGFLPKLDRKRYTWVELASNVKTYKVYIRPSNNHDRFGLGKEPSDAAVPLRDRAWAFQEYLLSPRSLQFGPTEMVWECREHIKCECGAGSLAPIPHERQSNHIISISFQQGLEILRPSRNIWETLVRGYTAKKITRDSDRFIALAGISKQVGDALDLQYCTGF